jgi:hypothetical protein
VGLAKNFFEGNGGPVSDNYAAVKAPFDPPPISSVEQTMAVDCNASLQQLLLK